MPDNLTFGQSLGDIDTFRLHQVSSRVDRETEQRILTGIEPEYDCENDIQAHQ